MGVIPAITDRYETPKIPEGVVLPSWLLDIWMLCWNYEPGGRPRSEEVRKMIKDGIKNDEVRATAPNGDGEMEDCASGSAAASTSNPVLPPVEPLIHSSIRLWDSTAGQERTPCYSDQMVCCVSFSPSGLYVATGEYHAPYYVRIWKLEGGDEVGRLHGHKGPVQQAVWKPDNNGCDHGIMITCSSDKSVKAWNLNELVALTGAKNRKKEKASDGQSSADVQTIEKTLWTEELESTSWEFKFSPPGDLVVVIDEEMGGKVLRVSNGEEMARFQYNEGMRLLAVAYSSDGKTIASGYRAGEICIWDALAVDGAASPEDELTSSPRHLKLLQALVPPHARVGHDRGVYGLEISPCNTLIAAACVDNVIRLWAHSSSSPDTLLREFQGHTGIVNSVAFTADSKYLISGSWDTTFRKWDVQRGIATMRKKCRARIFSVAVSPNGRYFLAGGG
jgi:WD40 repeat protein